MILSERPLLRRWLIRLIITFGVIAVLVLGVLWAATGPAGRWAVMHFGDDRALARGLTLEIDGLSGNVLHRPRIQRLAIRDTEGVFLVFENVAVDWNGLALLGGEIDIARIEAARMDVSRRPVLAPSLGGGGSLPSLRIGAINLPQLLLGEDVLGEAATFSVEGQGRVRENGRLALDIARTDVTGDHISGEVIWSETGALDGQASAFIAGSGPIGAMLRLDGRDAEISGTLSGTVESGAGELSFSLAGQNAADAEFDWQARRWTARIDADGSVLEAIRALPFDPRAQIEAEGTLSPLRPVRVDADGRGWELDITPDGPQRVSADIALSQPVWQALAGDNVRVGQARWSGTIDYSTGITADGVLHMNAIRAGEAEIDALGGSLLFTRIEGQNAIFADLTATDLRLPGSTPVSILPWAGLTVEARQENGVYRFEALSLTSDIAELTGDVQLDSDGYVLNGDARMTLLDMSALTDMASGQANADLRIQSLSGDGIILQADVDGGGIQWRDETLATLLTGASASARLESDYSSWRIDGLTLDSNAVALRGEAAGESRNWSATLDAAVNTDLPVSDVRIGGGAVIAMEAQGEGLNGAGEAVISTPRLEISGQSLSEPRVGLDFTYAPEQQTADWQLETLSDYGQVQATGTLERTPGEIDIVVNQGQIDSYTFEGRANSQAEGFSAELHARDWLLPNGTLTRLDVSASNRTGTLAITTQADGEFRDPFSLTAQTVVDRGEVSTELTADWAGIPVSTTDPVVYRFGRETPSLTGRLNTGGGETRINWTAGGQLQLRISDLPANILATATDLPEMDGSINADLGLRYSENRWSGSIEADARQLQVREIRLGSAVEIAVSGELDDNLEITLTVTGDDLSGRATAQREGIITDLRQLTDNAPLSGRIEMAGAIEPLLALVLPDSRQLAGQLNADLAISGNVFRPELRGETQFSNGRYVSEELGVSVDNVNATAMWENNRLRIERFTATGPRGGELNVSGEGGLGENGWEASVRSEFSSFNAVRRPDLSVIVSGQSDADISVQGIDITGDITIERIEARPPEASAPSFAEIDVTEVNHPQGNNGQSTARIPVSLDVQIRADDSIFVSGEPFSTEWRGDWHVTGSPSELNIDGDAVLVYGRAFLLNRAFRIEEGIVSLSGDVRSAEVDLLARHQREGLTVEARISGPVSSPELTLSSQPALPEDEILARLLFDRNSGQLSPLETATIAAQLSGQNLFGIVGGLRRAAGLDRLDFAAGENGEVVVTGGRQLTDDVYLELESRGTALSSARLEWTLTPDFTLLSRLTGDTEASIALRWRTEYD
ncbi:translocation/assembly module TamB domain-containing protein [Hyphobacterium sp.]|uniref:translocation/assembly module TamB domain-containing protein n=1 Tax=Hyphobacterium sp. TaxID=2004662 RepID=UPI003747E63B